ncbi:MAG: rsbT antagonist protein RsbS [Solirubrobacteraceae bacterium]|jgi:rsbT antagonist protein RsbS|nr:rsbT antagonist protein RsbS [Solirubrobacteraceae bacterium]
MGVPILKHGDHLIATLQEDVGDDDLAELMHDISERIGRTRSRGVILDVSELDVLDSYGTRTLRTIAQTTRMRGAATVIVGIQPGVAFAMVQLGLELDGVSTALDLEAGIEQLRLDIDARRAAI